MSLLKFAAKSYGVLDYLLSVVEIPLPTLKTVRSCIQMISQSSVLSSPRGLGYAVVG